jgi:predicted DNA-binding transcriptional regulator YafY
VRYRRRGAEAERELEPYGLVLKAGVWYLAARAVAGGAAGAAGSGAAGGTESSVEGGDRRVYRVDRIAQVEAGDERFVRDEEFDLPGFWEERSAAFARSILRDEVELRLTAAGMRRLRHVTDRKAAEEALANAEPVRAAPPGQEDQRQEEQQEEDGEGPAVVVLPVESLDVAYSQLLSLGAECEVLRPSSLRARFGETGRRMAELYGTAATSGTAGAMGAAGLPGAESHAESQR